MEYYQIFLGQEDLILPTFNSLGTATLNILDFNRKKASGPDNITSRFLKECAEEIADALVFIFDVSIKQGKIPEDWKKGIITTIYKGGNKNRDRVPKATDQ